jgi:hypothetical protein
VGISCVRDAILRGSGDSCTRDSLCTEQGHSTSSVWADS